MAAGLGIAAGAFAQNYANAMGLRSRLDSERQQQELAAINLSREKEFDNLQQELSAAQKNFLNPDFDYVSGKPYDPPQPGITPEGQQRPRDVWSDAARVNAHYNTMGSLLERQAVLARKNPLEVRREMEALRKNQFVERVGSALSLIEAGDEAGIKQLQAVYDLVPDGRRVTGGKFNEDGTVLLQYEKDGKPGERIITKEQLVEFGKLALNPADAAKLRFQLTESQKDRTSRENVAAADRTSRENVAGADRTSRENVAGADRTSREGIVNRELESRENVAKADRTSREGVAGADRSSRERISAADNASRETVAKENRVAAENDPTRVAQRAAADAQTQGRAQDFFNNRFQVDPRFAPKPESELKAIRQSEKDAYTKDLERWSSSTKLARVATTIASLNKEIPLAQIASITERLNEGKAEVFKDESSDRRFVKGSGGKRIYLD